MRPRRDPGRREGSASPLRGDVRPAAYNAKQLLAPEPNSPDSGFGVRAHVFRENPYACAALAYRQPRLGWIR